MRQPEATPVSPSANQQAAPHYHAPTTTTRNTPPHHHTTAPTAQADLQKEVERSKALAEAEGRIKENRENEDVNRRAAMLK